MTDFERLKDIVKDVPWVLVDENLTVTESTIVKENVQRQALYSDIDAELYTNFDTEIHIARDYGEDAPGMRAETELDLEAIAHSSIEHPLFFEEGIDVEALNFVLTAHNNSLGEPTEQELIDYDKPVVPVVANPHFEKIDSVINEKDWYTINMYSNGMVTYEEMVQDDDDKFKNKYANERKAYSILWKNLINRKNSYKMWYKLADSEPKTDKKKQYITRAKEEYKEYIRLSKILDKLKELSKRYWKEINYKAKVKLLEQFVAYQQASIKKGEDPTWTWEEVKKRKGLK